MVVAPSLHTVTLDECEKRFSSFIIASHQARPGGARIGRETVTVRARFGCYGLLWPGAGKLAMHSRCAIGVWHPRLMHNPTSQTSGGFCGIFP